MQKIKGWYIHLMQLRGFAEWTIKTFDWFMLRVVSGYPDEVPDWIRLLESEGRLTAGINYYRANFLEMVYTANYPNVTMPVVGLFSDGDRFLTEKQMMLSQKYCDSGFEFYKLNGVNHWMQLHASARMTELILNSLD